MTRAPLPDMPAPLVPAEVDLRGLDYMPFFGHHLLGSEFHARCSDAEWRAGVTLWWASWNQVPAASLPDDDVALCRLADLGRDVKEWKKLRDNALHGYVRCSDGRLYHKFLADQALIAWEKRVKEREKKKRWREGRNGSGDGDGTVPETGTRPGPRGGRNGPPPGDGTADGTGRDVKTQSALSQEVRPGPESPPLRALSGVTPDPETPKPVRQGELAKLLRALGVQATPGHPQLHDWVSVLDLTDDEARCAVEQARFRKPDGPIPVAYLDPIIRELRTKPKVNGAGAWWESESATNAIAAKYGVTAGNGEGWPEFRARIRKAIAQASGERSAA